MTQAKQPRRITVRVPATSANLGVGFDVLGLALDLDATFVFEPADELLVTGCDERFNTPDNLVWKSYLAACDALGLDACPLHIHEDSPIPASGGLGSSSTCVVAGIVAAQALAGRDIDRPFTLSLATRIEGHPDNVAPAVMGGLVSSYVDDGQTVTTRWPVAPNLRFVCLAPPYRVLTSDARMALPSMVPMSSVSWQVGRCLAMVSALASGRTAEIAACCHDRIHEPYRAPLIPDYERLQDACLAAGAITFLISGSGAAMLAICDGDTSAQQVIDAAVATMPELWAKVMRASERGASARFDVLP
ncbi:MAG: homoserine kinase [Atopobiaceae bacterium]|nr:homoserine kinase [Atopobiaceae bacterium]MBR1830275.1 homoserine kinase [Atopobiaceae bacterium]